jgi:chloride channel protein, CIC family
MGSEMTGGYALLAPMMLATFIAYAVSGQNNSIFKSQVMARSDSLAHNNNKKKEEKEEQNHPLPSSILKTLSVKDAMNIHYHKLNKHSSVKEAINHMENSHSKIVVITEEDQMEYDNKINESSSKLRGVVYLNDLLETPEALRDVIKLELISLRDPPETVLPSESLYHVFERLLLSYSSDDPLEIPVISYTEDRKILGTISMYDVIKVIKEYDKAPR